jgi:hypothetical protein
VAANEGKHLSSVTKRKSEGAKRRRQSAKQRAKAWRRERRNRRAALSLSAFSLSGGKTPHHGISTLHGAKKSKGSGEQTSKTK